MEEIKNIEVKELIEEHLSTTEWLWVRNFHRDVQQYISVREEKKRPPAKFGEERGRIFEIPKGKSMWQVIPVTPDDVLEYIQHLQDRKKNEKSPTPDLLKLLQKEWLKDPSFRLGD